MSEHTNSEGLSGSAGANEGRGHARRAVMLGAAAVGAGAVATVAGTGGMAMASVDAAPRGAVQPARNIVVKLPGTSFNIDQTIKMLQTVLGQVGCPGCTSGWDIHFIHETEFVVNAAGEVQAEI